MKIGIFAKQCGTTISTLRHYDDQGLLRPVHVDEFTGYRYYDASQIPVFARIEKCKEAGFTLGEIRLLLYANDGETVRRLFESNRARLRRMLEALEALQKTTSEEIVMKQTMKPFVEKIDFPFVDDEQVVGKWEVLHATVGGRTVKLLAEGTRELYFLPGGARYWCFGWTKGKLLFSNGTDSFANAYQIDEREDDLYMTLLFKSHDYPETGEITELTLKKRDSVRYTADEIARKDDVDRPFVNDERVLGQWEAVAFLPSGRKDGFRLPEHAEDPRRLFCKRITFLADGKCTSVYGERTVALTWTKGYVLHRTEQTACAYELRNDGTREYLLLEWKSGDYRWGGRDCGSYAFVRA